MQSLTVTEATRSYPQQTEAVKKWKESDIAEYKLPMVNFTQEENYELGTILTDLQTYQDESMFGFIMGTMDLSNWDSYLSQMKRSSTKVSEDFKKLPEETQINTLLSILNGIKEISNREENQNGSSED